MRTFPTILPNSPVSPNLPYSPLSPKALIKFCQICHFHHCMASFAKFTTFAAFAKSLGKILSNSPFSRLRAFLDMATACISGHKRGSTVVCSNPHRSRPNFVPTMLLSSVIFDRDMSKKPTASILPGFCDRKQHLKSITSHPSLPGFDAGNAP